jgi:hypothetical protein
VNWADDGRIAAEMLCGFSTARSPRISPSSRAHAYMFDWRALKHWGVDKKNLPPAASVLHREPKHWVLYKQYVRSPPFAFLGRPRP